MIFIHSTCELLGPMGQLPKDIDVRYEPMFFGADLAFAKEKGGPVTQAFISVLPPEWSDNVIFDSRVHMLMPGWYPCIPGWHHDDVPRRRLDGQPSYTAFDDPPVQHIMALVNGDICPTEFAVGSVEMPHVPDGKIVYGEWHPMVNLLIKNKLLVKHKIPSNQMISFNAHSFHRGTPAITSGWRWFGRVSQGSTRKVINEIRQQVQIYMSEENAGW